MSLIFSNENRILFNKENANQLLELTYSNRFIPLRDIFTLKVNEKNEVENTKIQKVTSYKAGVTYKKSERTFCTSNTSLRVLHINSSSPTSLNRFLMKSSLSTKSTLPMDYRRLKQLIQNKKKGEKLIIQKQRASTYKSTSVPYKAEICTHAPLQSGALYERNMPTKKNTKARSLQTSYKAPLCTKTFATRSPKIQNDKTLNFKRFLLTTNSNIFSKKLLQSFSLEKVQYYACRIVPRMSIWGFAFGSCFLLVIMTSILEKHEQNRWCFPFLKRQMPGLYTSYQENSWESFENIISKYLIRDKEIWNQNLSSHNSGHKGTFFANPVACYYAEPMQTEGLQSPCVQSSALQRGANKPTVCKERSFARASKAELCKERDRGVSKDSQGLQSGALYAQRVHLNKLRRTSKDMDAQTCQACLVKKIDLQKNQLYINFSEVWNLQLIKDFAGLFSCSDSALRCVQSSALQSQYKPSRIPTFVAKEEQSRHFTKRSFAKNMLMQSTYNVMPSIKSQWFLEPFYKMNCRIPRHHLSISRNANSSLNIITPKLLKRFAFKERMFLENNTIPSKMSSSANTVFADNYKIRNIATFEKGEALNKNKKDNATYRLQSGALYAMESSLFNKGTLESDLPPSSANFCNNAVQQKFAKTCLYNDRLPFKKQLQTQFAPRLCESLCVQSSALQRGASKPTVYKERENVQKESGASYSTFFGSRIGRKQRRLTKRSFVRISTYKAPFCNNEPTLLSSVWDAPNQCKPSVCKALQSSPVRANLRFAKRCKQSGALQRTWIGQESINSLSQGTSNYVERRNDILKKFFYEYGFFSIPAKALFTPPKEQDILKTNLPKTQLQKTIFSSLPILQSVEPKKSFGKPISIINLRNKIKSPLYTFQVDKRDNFNKGNALRCTYKAPLCKPLQNGALQSGACTSLQTEGLHAQALQTEGLHWFGASNGALNTPIDKSSCYNLYKTHTIGSRFLSGYRSSEIKNLQTSYKQKVYIKVPPALPFYFPSFIQGIFYHQKKFAHKKMWVICTRLANRTAYKAPLCKELCKERGFTKWSFVRTFLHDVSHFGVSTEQSITQVSDFHHKKQLIDKRYITCKNSKIRALKKMPYRQLALNEFQEIQPLFEKVNQENRISPYKMDFKKPLFTDYHDYLSRPKDSPGAIAISPSLEEDQGIQQSWTEHIEREILADQNKSFKEKLNDTEEGRSNSFVGLDEEKEFNEEDKKNEITKWEWLQNVRDSESDVEKRKDFQRLAYPKKEALFTKRLLVEKNPKTPLQNFLVSDRKSSFFGITNIFPKRLIAEDQRQINNQILGKDNVRRSIEFFIALNKKKSNIKNVMHLSLQSGALHARANLSSASPCVQSSALQSRCKPTVCKERGFAKRSFARASKSELCKERDSVHAELSTYNDTSQHFENEKERYQIDDPEILVLQGLVAQEKGGFIDNPTLPITPNSLSSTQTVVKMSNPEGQERCKRSTFSAKRSFACTSSQTEGLHAQPRYKRTKKVKVAPNKKTVSLLRTVPRMFQQQTPCLSTFFCTYKCGEGANKAFKPLQPQRESRALQKTCLNLNKQTDQQVQSISSFDNVSRTKRKEMNCYPPVYTPNRRLRLRVTESSKNPQNNNSQSRIDSLNLCQSHRWWQKRRAPSSLLGAPSKRYMVMPEITRSDWTKILEWQLKTYFLEEEKRLQPLLLNKTVKQENNQKELIVAKQSSAKPIEVSRNFKIKKIAIYLPWLTLKKALKKPFEWPLTRLSYQSQTLRNNNQGNLFTLNKQYSANLRFPFPRTNPHSLQRTCLCKKGDPYKDPLYKQIGFVTKKNKNFENENELQIEDTSWFTINKKPDSCLVSSLSPQFKTLSLKLSERALYEINHTRAKAAHKSKVYKHFVFEIISKDSHLLIHQLFLAIAIKQIFQKIYYLFGKIIVDKIKNSSLGIALLPLFFNAYSRENQTSTRYHLKKRLKDVVGSEDTISSLSEIVWYLRNSCRGRMIPRGVVLLETHDSESTEFLKAVGGEAQVPVIVQSLRALPFTQNHPQRRLEKILKFAQKCAPCILFLDDLDAIGKERPLLINGTKDNTRFNRSANRNNRSFHAQNDAFTKTSFVQRGVSIGNEKQKWKGYNWIKPNRLNSILFRKSKSQEAHTLLLDHFLANRGSYTGACSLDKKCINKHLQRSACVARTRLCKPKVCIGSTNSTLFTKTSVESKNKTSSNSIISETEKTLNQRRLDLMLRLLTVMDGISHLKGVLIVTTSKNPASLDPALLRPGRFERFINLKLPSKKRRIQLLKMQTSKIGHTNLMPWEYLAEETENMSGASISNAINHSAFKAIIQSTTHTPVTLEYGINRVKGEVLTSNKNLSFNFPKFIRKRRQFLKSCNTSCTSAKVLSQKYFTTRASIKVASPFGDTSTNSAFRAYPESKKSGVLLFKRNLCAKNDRSCLTTQQGLITPLQNDFSKINQISGFTSLTSFYQAGKGVLQSLLSANKVNVRILDFTQNLVKLYAGRASQSLYLDSTLRSRTKLRFVRRCISTYKAPFCKVPTPLLLHHVPCNAPLPLRVCKERGRMWQYKAELMHLQSEALQVQRTCNPTFKNNGISFSFLQSNVSYIEHLEAMSYISSILNYLDCNLENRVSLHQRCNLHATQSTFLKGLQSAALYVQKRSRAKLRLHRRCVQIEDLYVPASYVRHTYVRTFLHSACTFTKRSFARATERSKDYWVEEKTCNTFKIFKRPTGNWYRLYLPELEQNKSNQEWRIPDCFFHQSNSLLNVKSVLQNGKNVILSKDVCYSNIVSSFFYTSFQNLSENRELLDIFADHLIRFKSLQSHEIRRISLFYMNPNLI